jgi:hypothetical protein
LLKLVGYKGIVLTSVVVIQKPGVSELVVLIVAGSFTTLLTIATVFLARDSYLSRRESVRPRLASSAFVDHIRSPELGITYKIVAQTLFKALAFENCARWDGSS